MRTIDIHAHLVPRSLWRAAEAGRPWHGFRHEPGEGLGTVVGGGKRIQFSSSKVRLTPEERLADMDAQGVDVQVISIHTPLFGFGEAIHAVSIEMRDLDWRENLNVPFRAVALSADIEINPQGQFLFAEALSGLDLTKELAAFLAREA